MSGEPSTEACTRESAGSRSVRSRWVWWLTVGLVAAHFGFGIANEITGSEVARLVSLVAAGLAVVAALLGLALVYRS